MLVWPYEAVIGNVLMPVIAIAALMGFLFLPGSASAPVPAVASTTVAVAVKEDEPSKRLATSHEVAQSYTVSMTAYNALPEQTDGDPFTTASGAYSNPEVVAARSRDFAEAMPFGTVIALERTAKDTPGCQYSTIQPLIGYRVIADSMNARFTNKIDILLDENDTVSIDGRERNPAEALGLCGKVTVRIVGHVDIRHMPKTQAELQEMFGGAKTLAIAR